MKITLEEVAEIVGGQLVGANADVDSVCSDSRSLKEGDLFFALKGQNFNGEVFVERAFESGACGAVVSALQEDLPGAQILVDDVAIAFGALARYKRSQHSAKVIAITGSCGKTTVKGMLRSILPLAGKTHATHANFNNHIGVPLTIFSCPSDADYMVVEAGTSTPGEIGYLTQLIDPDVAAVINVHPAHIKGFGSLEAIASEKSRIYTFGERQATMIVNNSLIKYPDVLDKCENRDVVLFGMYSEPALSSASKEIKATEVASTENGGTRFSLNIDGNAYDVLLNIPGQHQVENALAAAACASAVGVEPSIIVEGLGHFSGEKGRMQTLPYRKGQIIDDSYNANPASMRAAIDLLAQKTRSLLVLGDMGELGAGADRIHREVGDYAAKNGVDQLVCIGAFADDYCDGFGEKSKKFLLIDELIAYLSEQLVGDTTVLIKGSRFMKMERVVDGLISIEGSV